MGLGPGVEFKARPRASVGARVRAESCVPRSSSPSRAQPRSSMYAQSNV